MFARYRLTAALQRALRPSVEREEPIAVRPPRRRVSHMSPIKSNQRVGDLAENIWRLLQQVKQA